ncbi:MAG: hypothetical protein JNM96_03760 [Bacteroidia bacterium]|nr:hypothetical protein [Bacteroidia bacterium]
MYKTCLPFKVVGAALEGEVLAVAISSFLTSTSALLGAYATASFVFGSSFLGS